MKKSIVGVSPAEIDKLAREAWSDAARRALEQGLPTAGSRDGRIFRYHPDQLTEDLGPVSGASPTGQALVAPSVVSPDLQVQGNESAEAYREMAEVRLSQAADVYQRAKAAVEAATGLGELTRKIDEDASAYRLKLIEIARSNTGALFDFAEEMASARSQVEALEIWHSHCRRFMQIYATQTKELADLTRHFATGASASPQKTNNKKDSSVA